MGETRQAFMSYRTHRRDEVTPLVEALEHAGVRVWRDEPRIDEGASITNAVLAGLSGSHVLLAWYSDDYPKSRICQWEQALAWVAAEAAGSPLERVRVLWPPGVPTVDHVPELQRDAKLVRLPTDPAELVAYAQNLAEDILALDHRTLGTLAPLNQPPEWLLRPRMHPSERFVGRAKALWDLHGHIHRDKVTAITGRTGTSPAQVRGMGGNGKTLLAAEYIARFGVAFPGGVFWVDTAGQTPEGVHASVATRLGLPADDPHRLRHILSQRGSYLWVVDNLAQGLSQAEVEAWCAPTANGRTLVTTRCRTWNALGQVLDLGVLKADEAFSLLTRKRRPTSKTEEEAATEIARLVGHHPLTVDVLAALLALSPEAEPYAAWVRNLDDAPADALALGEQLAEELPTGSARYVGTVLRVSLAGLAEPALDLLRLAVSLAEAPIPSALAVAAFGALADPLPTISWAIGLSQGGARSLLEQSDGAPAYTVHALVRRVLEYDTAHAARIRELRGAACGVMPGLFGGVEDVREHGRIGPLVPHAEELAGEVRTATEAAFLGSVAHFHEVRGSYAESRAKWERALEARTRLLGPEHPDTLTTLQNVAGTLHAQGDLAGARRLYERALEALTRLLGPDHPDTVTTLQNLGVTLVAQGDPTGGRSFLERALEARGRVLGPDHPDTLGTLQNVAMALNAQGDRELARRHYQRAHKAMTRVRGPEHPDTLRTLQNLAATLYAQGHFERAREHYERARDARVRVLGPEHPGTLRTTRNLASPLRALGAHDRARRFNEQALEAMTRVLGAEHPDTLRALQDLSRTLAAQGDRDGAKRLNEQALEATTRVLNHRA